MFGASAGGVVNLWRRARGLSSVCRLSTGRVRCIWGLSMAPAHSGCAVARSLSIVAAIWTGRLVGIVWTNGRGVVAAELVLEISELTDIVLDGHVFVDGSFHSIEVDNNAHRRPPEMALGQLHRLPDECGDKGVGGIESPIDLRHRVL